MPGRLLQHGQPGRGDLLSLAATFPARYPCLLESVVHGTAQSRWDILLAFPREVLQLGADACLTRDGQRLADTTFLDALDADWRAARTAPAEDDLPFHGGWALYLAYELCADIEPGLSLPPCADGTPMAMALRCPAAIVYDHATDRTVAVAERGHADLLECLLADLARPSTTITPMPPPLRVDEELAQRFLDDVARVHAHLRAGDVFQVNLSRGWRAQFAEPPPPTALYAALRKSNPAPFAALWQQPGWAVASSSPERLVEVRGRHVQTRPIAGTFPRLAGEDDAQRARELVAHPKERAEHIMLVDLERNDLGRVCRPGSIEVDQLMTVESHAHVHHLVSNVRGCLRDDVSPGQVIAAAFPGGTITGCPKFRCMQIIAALERTGRGAYTGAIGYLDGNGDMDLNILIRSFTASGTAVGLRAGAGIVVDSRAQHELEETRAKARGLLRALGVDA